MLGELLTEQGSSPPDDPAFQLGMKERKLVPRGEKHLPQGHRSRLSRNHKELKPDERDTLQFE